MKKLKLDLHTHCLEATCTTPPTLKSVERVVEAVKTKGLDGIAVTEHCDRTYGFLVKDIVDRHFPGQLLIIPGQEVNVWPLQVVELYLPEGDVFRFVAHPGYPGEFTEVKDGLHGVEIENPLHNWHIKKDKIMELAQAHDLLLLSNSDAHFLDDIGAAYTEISLEELTLRARRAS